MDRAFTDQVAQKDEKAIPDRETIVEIIQGIVYWTILIAGALVPLVGVVYNILK